MNTYEQKDGINNQPVTIFQREYQRRNSWTLGYAICFWGRGRDQILVRYVSGDKWITAIIDFSRMTWGHKHFPLLPTTKQLREVEDWQIEQRRQRRIWERIQLQLVLDKHCSDDGGLHRYLVELGYL